MKAATYNSDEHLFKQLGLPLFEDAPHATYLAIGRVNFEDGSYIDVSVQCWPAQFWKFEIYKHEKNENYVMTTGSGLLSDYWQTASMIAENMVGIKFVGIGDREKKLESEARNDSS